MNNQIVLRVISKFIIPYILMFGFYVQLHGEYSPGGGFQAGVILASAFILYALIFGVDCTLKVFPLAWQRFFAATGALIYGGVGTVAMLRGGKFLDYSALMANPVKGQKVGIMIIELGVGITVCAVMLLLYFTFAMHRMQKNKESH